MGTIQAWKETPGMNSKETRRNRSAFETTMRAVLQWFGFAAFLFSASLLFLKMGFYELSVLFVNVSTSYGGQIK